MEKLDIINKLIEIQFEIEKGLAISIEVYYKNKYNELLRKLKYYKVDYTYNNPQDVIDTMIEKYNLKGDFATNKIRSRNSYVKHRQRAMFLIRHLFKEISLAEIGSYFNNKNHPTVLHAIKTVKNLCDTDNIYRSEFKKIQKEIIGYEFY